MTARAWTPSGTWITGGSQEPGALGILIAAGVLLCLLVVALGCVFVVSETEQAVVVRLGRPVRVVAGDRGGEDLSKAKAELETAYKERNRPVKVSAGPGLYFKWPLIESVAVLEDRIIDYNSDPADVVTKDKKHLLVDNFARWRIADPLLFYETVRDENGANARLDNYVYSTLREELAKSELIQTVRSTDRELDVPDEKGRPPVEGGRGKIMTEVSRKARALAREIGIEVVDVRIKRADLPKENETAVFGRMRAERERISTQFRSEGQELAQKMRAETEKQVTVMVAEALRQAAITKGEGDAKAAATYARAYQSQPEFYSFVKALDAARASIDGKTKIVIGTDSGLYQILTGKPPKL